MTSIYIFKVKVFEGRDLVGKDKSGSFSYPFVVLAIGNLQAKSKALKSLNPVWNEDLTLQMNEIPDNVLIITCLDKSKLSASDFMGKVEIPLTTLFEKRQLEDWYNLETNDKKEVVSGSLHLAIEFVGEVPKKPVKPAPKPVATPTLPIPTPKTPSIQLPPSSSSVSPSSPIVSPVMSPVSSPHPKRDKLSAIARSMDKSDEDNASKTKSNRNSYEPAPTISVTQDGEVVEPQSPKAASFRGYNRGSIGATSLPSLAIKEKKKFGIGKLLGKSLDKPNSLPSSPKGSMENVNSMLVPTSPRSPRGKAVTLQVKLGDEIIVDDLQVSTELQMSDVIRMIEEATVSRGLFTNATLGLYNLYYRQNKKLKILKRHKTVGHYKLPQQAVIEMLKPQCRKLEMEPELPFSTYYEKYDIDPAKPPFQQRSEEDLLFEFALNCILYPTTGDAPRSRNRLVPYLEEQLNIPKDRYQEILKRVEKYGQGKKSLLVELEHRLATVNRHPFYNRETYKGQEPFDRWKKREIQSIRDMFDQQIFGDSDFYGNLIVKIVQARISDNKTAKDWYCIARVQNQDKETKTAKKTMAPVWNETFEFAVEYHENNELVIELWDKGMASAEEMVDKITIPLDEFKLANNGNIFNQWYTMEGTHGAVHIDIEYNYHYAKFVQYAASDNPEQKEGCVVDHNILYDRLTKVLIEEVYSKEDVITLPTESNWLMLEYALRFGIDYTYTKLATLKYLQLQPKRGLLNLIEETLADALDCKVQSMTSAEASIYIIATQQLLANAQDLLMKYKSAFPRNTPAGCFSTLIEITMLLFGEEQEKEAYESITRWLKLYMEKRYKTVVMSLQQQREPEEEQKWGSVLQPKEMLVLISILQEEIQNDALFKDSVPREIDLMLLSTKTYYTSLREQVKELVDKPEYPPLIFDLYFKLKEFQNFLLTKANKDQKHFKFLALGEMFVPYIYSWLKESKDRIAGWVQNAIQMDTKTPVSDTDLHSSSVVDVFSALTGALQFMQSLELKDPFCVTVFAEVLSHTVHGYVKQTAEEIENQIGNVESVVKKKKIFNILNDHSPTSPDPSGKKREKRKFRISLKLKKSASAEDKSTPKSSTPVSPNSSTSSTPSGSNRGSLANPDSIPGSPSPHISIVPEEPIANHIIPIDLCVQLDNVESAKTQFDLMATELEAILDRSSQGSSALARDTLKDTFEVCLRDTLRFVREELTRLEGLIAKKMNLFVQKKLSETLEVEDKVASNAASDELFTYLDDSFATLSEHLYSDLFQKILQALWLLIVQGITDEVFPPNDRIKANLEQAIVISRNFESLKDYFHADGSGLPLKFLEEKSEALRKLLKVSEKSTKELLDLYVSLKGSPPLDGIVTADHVKKLLEAREDTDKDAHAFLTELDQVEDASPGEKTEHQKIREHFLLPETELILDKYLVASQGKSGHLFLTTSYILFDAIIGGGADQPYQIAIPLKDIESISRSKKMMIEQIEVQSPDGKTVFQSIKRRKTMIQDIVAQAQKMGNKKIVASVDLK